MLDTLERPILNASPLDGLRILILEDEFLIAMDVEQLCRDHGATDVVISRSLDGLGSEPLQSVAFDAAVVDLRLGGVSTLDFAKSLFAARVPFVFATGYVNPQEVDADFPGVEIVSKPYLGADLIGALASAVQRRRLESLSGPD